MLIGYVRVSTNDQSTELQRNALECAGCELIFEDKISGTKSDRPGLKKLLRTLSEGDTLVVWKLDRLGRSMRHLVILVEELRERGVNFRSLTDAIDTSTPMGRFFFHVMGALAEMERELIVERTRAGLEAARAKGRIGGRRPKLTTSEWEQAGRLLAAGESRQRVHIPMSLNLPNGRLHNPPYVCQEHLNRNMQGYRHPQQDIQLMQKYTPVSHCHSYKR
ncbi:Resolvase domain-containing protein [Escherichia coli]|nr:Resolvase domain-containing protein [Escherichia coli]